MKTLPSLNHALAAQVAGKSGGKAAQGGNGDASFAKLLHRAESGLTQIAQRHTDANTMKSRIDDRSDAHSQTVKPEPKAEKSKTTAHANADRDSPDPLEPAGDEAAQQIFAKTDTVALPIFALRPPTHETLPPRSAKIAASGNDQAAQPEASSKGNASADAPAKAEPAVAPRLDISASAPQPAAETNQSDVASGPKVEGVASLPQTEEPLPQPTTIRGSGAPRADQVTTTRTANESKPAVASRTHEEPMASRVRQNPPPSEPSQKRASIVETEEAKTPQPARATADAVSIPHTEVTTNASIRETQNAKVRSPPVALKSDLDGGTLAPEEARSPPATISEPSHNAENQADDDVAEPATAKPLEPITAAKPIIQTGATPPFEAKIVSATSVAATPQTSKASGPETAAPPTRSEDVPIHLEIVASEEPTLPTDDITLPQKAVATPSAPSFAAELTRAATRYSFLPATSNPRASATNTLSDDRSEPTDTVQTRVVASAFSSALRPLDQPLQAVESGSEQANEVDPAPEERRTRSARVSDVGAPDHAESNGEPGKLASGPTSAASGLGSTNSVTPSNAVQTPSPATAVASAIIAEPSWRPASVASPTQSPLDRIADPAKTLSVQLNPGTLGVVTATLSMSGGQLKVHLSAESGEAHERLKTESHTIEKAMRSLGYEVSEIVIAQSPIVSPSTPKPDSSAVGHQPAGREPQSSGSNGSAGGERSGSQNGERNGNGGTSNSGGHAPRPADRSPGGVYI